MTRCRVAGSRGSGSAPSTRERRSKLNDSAARVAESITLAKPRATETIVELMEEIAK